MHVLEVGSPQAVAAAALLAWQVPVPLQESGLVQVLEVGSPHAVAAGSKASTGQLGVLPSHTSCTSQSPPSGRQTLPPLPAACVHVPLPLHSSTVQVSPSVVHGVPAVSSLP